MQRLVASRLFHRALSTMRPLSWGELEQLATVIPTREELVRGKANAQTNLRLFGSDKESDVRLTLFRDNHAW